jgi:hypothetical protein
MVEKNIDSQSMSNGFQGLRFQKSSGRFKNLSQSSTKVKTSALGLNFGCHDFMKRLALSINHRPCIITMSWSLLDSNSRMKKLLTIG